MGTNVALANQTSAVGSEPYFFDNPLILVTGVKNFNDFLPVANSTAQCINRLTRLAIIVALLLSIILRSWWPIVTVGGAIILAILIAWGYQAYTKARRQSQAREAVENAVQQQGQAVHNATTASGSNAPNVPATSQLLGDTRPSATERDAEEEKREEEDCDFDDASPILPDCAIDHRYEQIVAEQARLYDREFGERDCIIEKLEQCAPYDPTATIPQPSRRNVIVPKCIGSERTSRFGDGSCGRESAAEKEERAIANARIQGNPNTGRVSTMLGINAEQATLENLPPTYRRSSMNTDINGLYDNVQKQGPSGTRARTTEMERGGARPMHDPTEKMLNSMWQDSTEQIWKTQFLDRRPPPFLNPADPTSRRLEEQSAASRAAYKSMSWSNSA